MARKNLENRSGLVKLSGFTKEEQKRLVELHEQIVEELTPLYREIDAERVESVDSPVTINPPAYESPSTADVKRIFHPLNYFRFN